jgi:hypothetical protein
MFEAADDGLTPSDPGEYAAGKVVTKFCNFGIVTSKKWNSTYITIIDGRVRLYDTEESCRENPHSHVMEILISKHHKATEIVKKNYSQDKMKIIDFFCFYIEVDNGLFAPTKLLKVGAMEEHVSRNLADCINRLVKAAHGL